MEDLITSNQRLTSEVERLRLENAALRGPLTSPGSTPGSNFARRRTNHHMLMQRSTSMLGLGKIKKQDHAHGSLVKSLLERGQVEGFLCNSSDVSIKRVEVGNIVHEEPSKILEFLLKDSKAGILRRHTIHKNSADEGEGLVVYWLHYLEGGRKIVEYLLHLVVKEWEAGKGYTIEVNSVKEQNVPAFAKRKLQHVVPRGNTIPQRAKIDGQLRIGAQELGQSSITLVATLEAGIAGTIRDSSTDPIFGSPGGGGSPKGGSPKGRSIRRITSRMSVRAKAVTKATNLPKVDVNLVFTSAKGIINDVIQKEFHQPDVIDARRKTRYVEECIPNAPPLVKQEEEMIEGRLELIKLTKDAKRIGDSLKTEVEKFIYVDEANGAIFGVSNCTMDCSADQIVADICVGDTYEASVLHKKKNGNLPRLIVNNLDGTRSQQYSAGKRLVPPYEPRVFHGWRSWKKVVKEDGSVVFYIAFVPLDEYVGTKQDVKIDCKHKIGQTQGLFVIEEIAPKVCNVYRVQSVDVKAASLPTSLMILFAKSNLKWADEKKAYFSRNAGKVDKEIREMFMSKVNDENIQLEEDQEEVFRNLEDLFHGGSGKWKKIKSPFEGVKMKMKFKKQKRGESTICLGHAEGVIDCTPEEALAWYFHFCSQKRSRKDRENGNVRFEVSEWEKKRGNEKLFACIRKMPFLVSNRDFVQRFIWKKTSEGNFCVGVWSVEKEEVNNDYGGFMGKLIRGQAKAIITLSSTAKRGEIHQCKMDALQYFNLKGFVPSSFVYNALPGILGVVNNMKLIFQRDEEIDKTDLEELVETIKTSTESYSFDELAAITKGKEFYMKCKESKKMKELKTNSERVKLSAVIMDGESLVAGYVEAIIDAPIEECVAYEYKKDTREKLNGLKKRKIVKQMVKRKGDHSQLYLSIRNLGVRGFKNREFRASCIWQKDEEGNIWTTYQDTSKLNEEFPIKDGNVLGSSRTTWKFEALPKIGEISQTKVSFTSLVDIGGNVPNYVMNRLTKKYAKNMYSILEHFDKSIEVDASKRKEFTKAVEGLDEETDVTNEICNVFDEDPVKKHKVERAFPLTETWAKFEGAGKGWGKATARVRASLEETAAFYWDFESRTNRETTGDVDRVVLRTTGAWERVVRRTQRLESAHGGLQRRRNFLSVLKLHRIDEDNIVITMKGVKGDINETQISEDESLSDSVGDSTTKPLNVADNPTAGGRPSKTKAFMKAEAYEDATIKFSARGLKETKVEYVTRINIGKSVSEKSTMLALMKHLDEATSAQRYFNSLVPLEDMTKEVGEALGTDMVWDGGELGGVNFRKNKMKHVEMVCKSSLAIIEVTKKYPWFILILQRARQGQISLNHSMSTKLECVTEKEAKVIGNNLMPCLKSRKVAKTGVDQWRLQNRAVGELFEEFPWVEDMFVAVSEGVVKAAPWGLMFRVILGALTSMVDLLTDIYITIMFYNGDRMGFFWVQCGMLITSVFIQLLLVYAQNMKLGYRKLGKEALIVIIGMKPAVDAFRFVSGQKEEVGANIDILTEMTAVKGIELFAESIPGVIIQFMAIYTQTDVVATAAWISLGVSALSTGFIGATISYDYDTDPEKRDTTPAFYGYGYVPAKPLHRSVVFMSLVGFSAGMLLIRCLTIVLLGLLGKGWAFAFIGADLSLYLLIKLARRDFWYWLPLGGKLEMLTSFLFRALVKIINDFTSIPQLRHPNEVGGLYWTFSLALSMASLPAAVYTHEIQGGDNKVTAAAWSLAWKLLPTTGILFTIFILHIERSYWKTFWSFQRGKDICVQYFRDSITDEMKAKAVFKRSRHLWSSIEEEVKGWVAANYDLWDDENPKWFNEKMRSKIPKAYIPSERLSRSMKDSINYNLSRKHLGNSKKVQPAQR
mmetsp:Transcript_18700/g.38909  ORF Transcript_18700/g.38909 Transcript_18700/m.38909 type:complete len:1880 (-) Transcript_18700:55-5694(-)